MPGINWPRPSLPWPPNGYEEARRLAESAQVDAELAEAKAEAEIVRRAADQLWKKSEVPATKAERESREPLTPGAEKE